MISEPWHVRYPWSLPLRARWSRARMGRFRNERFRWMVRHAAATMPFYRRLLEETGVDPGRIRGLADRELLPLVTREALRQAGEAAWASDLPPPARWIASTSGSSGNPLILLFDRSERLRTHLVNMHCEWLYGWRPWYRSMGLGTQFVPPQGTWLQRLGLVRWKWVDPARPVGEWVDLYEQWRPHSLRAYPSALREFCAEARLRGGLRWRPRVLAAGGELYPPELDEPVSQTFGMTPVLVYGAMEAGRIAFGCRPGGALHVRMDGVDLEILLDDGRPAPPGQNGQVVLTSLLYGCMPVIRYRLGDLACWDDAPCGCGLWWPRIRLHEGRGSEVLALPDGRRVPITTVGGVIGRVPGLRQYQFVQRAATALAVRYAADGDVRQMEIALAQLRAMLSGVEVTGERVERIAHTATGKVRRFVRYGEPADPEAEGSDPAAPLCPPVVDGYPRF